VREVDHVHDAEHQRQARGEQEQHQAELHAVQRLLEKQDGGHANKKGVRAIFRNPRTMPGSARGKLL